MTADGKGLTGGVGGPMTFYVYVLKDKEVKEQTASEYFLL